MPQGFTTFRQFKTQNSWVYSLCLLVAGCAGARDHTVTQHPAPPRRILAEVPVATGREADSPATKSNPSQGAIVDAGEALFVLQPVDFNDTTARDSIDVISQNTRAARDFVKADNGSVVLVAGDDSRSTTPEVGSPIIPPDPGTVTDFPTDRPIVHLDLPTALALVGGQHPVVGFAQWRVQESYARLDQAQVLWLPTLQAGTSFSRHDGTIQDTFGIVRDVNRSSLQAGLGAGAVGAGTTQNPGVVAQFQVSDAIFQPRIAQKTAWARQHAATTAYNDQLLQVALAHLRLLATKQDQRVIEEIHGKTAELAQITRDYAETGEGLQADADRMLTEAMLVQSRVVEARERAQIAVARLAEAVSLDFEYQIELVDPMLVPIELTGTAADESLLISTGLRGRPELKEAQCLVAAACEQYNRQKYAPFVPSVLLGFSQTGFGGGLGISSANFAQRVDYDAMALWQIRNLGFGEAAARNEASARIEQSKFEQLRLMDRVAREISEARTQVIHRRQRVEINQGAIRSAMDSYNRNLSRIRDGQGLPIEVLQSIQALEQAQRAFVTVVSDYNESQFRLQWALGWPIQAM
jgi:outer membrane protein TolC